MRAAVLSALVMAALLAVIAGAALRYGPGPSESPFMLEKTLPALSGQTLAGEEVYLKPEELRGRIVLVNMFASWCPPCRDEHPLLRKLAAREGLDIIGIAHRADPDAAAFLEIHGNPYSRVIRDIRGEISVALAISGLPETLVVSPHGTVKARITGPITPEMLDSELVPLLETLQ